MKQLEIKRKKDQRRFRETCESMYECLGGPELSGQPEKMDRTRNHVMRILTYYRMPLPKDIGNSEEDDPEDLLQQSGLLVRRVTLEG